MDRAREPRDPVPEGQPGAARDATREPAREPRPATPPGQPGARRIFGDVKNRVA